MKDEEKDVLTPLQERIPPKIKRKKSVRLTINPSEFRKNVEILGEKRKKEHDLMKNA